MALNSHFRGTRTSFASRVSSIFERRRVPTQDLESSRNTTTFEVPLFLSPSRYEGPRHHSNETSPETIHESNRSRSSTRSLIEPAISLADRVRPLTLPSSSRYSSPAASPIIPQPPVLPLHEPSELSSISTSQTTASNRSINKNASIRRRRRRRTSAKLRIQALTRLTATFGLTLGATLVTYLALAVTGTGVGIMFHILMILLVLSLTGVFAHSALRLFFLSRKANNRIADRRREPRWHGQTRQNGGSFFGEIQPELLEQYVELPPEKPIRVIMVEDEEAGLAPDTEAQILKQPPPVYGNFRSSKRINPNLVHWQKVPPSPLTPTYDEAMLDIHRVVGYRPPSYIESESGATLVVEQGKHDVDQALQNIHPLERQRVAELSQNMI